MGAMSYTVSELLGIFQKLIESSTLKHSWMRAGEGGIHRHQQFTERRGEIFVLLSN